MNIQQSLVIGLLCCSTSITDTNALDTENSTVLFDVDGDSVSADIKAKPLSEVALSLSLIADVKMHFAVPRVRDQVITARFEKLALEAALRTILKNTNYAMVAGKSEPEAGIQVYIYPNGSEVTASEHPPANETAMASSASSSITQEVNVIPADPSEVPPPPISADPDPAVRLQELENIVAAHGPQSLAQVLAVAQDLDPKMRSAAERLLLNDLRGVVPKEILSKIALTSEQADTRLQALEALAELHDQPNYVRMTLESAQHDTDIEVQQHAQNLLQKFSEQKPY